jgi:hypothetical protein
MPLRDVQLDALIVRDQDHRGRRTRNAADGILNQDYITLYQLKALEERLTKLVQDKVNGSVTEVSNSYSVTGVTAYKETQTFTADAAVTTTYTSPATNDFLTKVLILDATGGWAITSWNAIFTGVTVNDFVNLPSYINTYLFQWNGTKWSLLFHRANA